MGEKLTVREACRQRKPLDGTDAQALEHGMTQLESDNAKLRAEVENLKKCILDGAIPSMNAIEKERDVALLQLQSFHRRLTEAVNSRCSCGGAGLGEGCDWCNLYHHVKGTDKQAQPFPKLSREEMHERDKQKDATQPVYCRECGGTGEIGLADGDVPCPQCGGSGNPSKPGIGGRNS